MISFELLNSKKFLLLRIFIFIILSIVLIIIILSLPPKDFPKGIEINIPKNTGLSGIAKILDEKGIIKSPLLFIVETVLMGGQDKILAGDYIFKNKQSSITIAYRMIKGEHGLSKVKITIPEGITVYSIANIISKRIKSFDKKAFMNIASTSEGYLFPDTYFFYTNVNALTVFDTLRDAFDSKITSIMPNIILSGRKKEDIIIMASIIEKEASDKEDRRMISGILWKRLDENIPLQVDVSIIYITSRISVSIADTKIDSPYNTYKYKGLPKGPISNPSTDAILSAINPKSSKYYYYLSDKEGETHYAVDYKGHLENKRKYLK